MLMPIIDLPPYGDVALFYNRDAETHVVHTWDPCPTNIHSDKFIYWVSKDNKVVEKGCWIPGKKIDELVLILIETDTNEPAPDLFPVKVLNPPIET